MTSLYMPRRHREGAVAQKDGCGCQIHRLGGAWKRQSRPRGVAEPLPVAVGRRQRFVQRYSRFQP